MADLSDYRREIDEIDAQMIPLFERRMNAVRKVAAYKKEHQLPVLQQGREEIVLQKAVDHLDDPVYEQEAKRFMNAVMAISRQAQQRDIRSADTGTACVLLPCSGIVGYQGVAGSFSEEALIRHFGPDCKRRDYAEWEDVFAALQKGEIDYGVLPIENSSTGSISKVYDLLGVYGFYIVGERRLRVSQNLVGTQDASLGKIKTVYSHPQGIEQCSQFLARHREWELVPFHNTAVSAKRVAEENDPSQAAIASKRAAELYGLQVLAPDIQDSRHNVTRFIVIGREMLAENADKVSITFTLDNESGTLYNTLRHFAQRGINLVKIESRPIPETLWNYRFYLDFEGNIDADDVKAVLQQISDGSRELRVLGAYKSDVDQ